MSLHPDLGPAESTVDDRKAQRRRSRWPVWLFVFTVGPALIGRFVYDEYAFSKVDPKGHHRANYNIKFYESEDALLLHGGEEEEMHFDISRLRIDKERLEYGLGRETFPALVEPQFELGSEKSLGDFVKVIVVKIEDDVRVYPLSRLGEYEVVNDTIGDRSIMVGYCVLGDLGAVYDRRVGDVTYTFGVSGYTYWEPKVWDYLSAFVLWDRETESLWWPPAGKAVSGPSVDIPMKLLDDELWAQTTWGEVKKRFPNVKILKKGQNFERPESWAKCHPPEVERARFFVPAESIPPKWGQNASLPE